MSAIGYARTLKGAEVLEKIAREGVLAKIQTGGNLDRELAYGNHRNAAGYWREVATKATADVSCGRATISPVTRADEIVGSQTYHVGVVVEEEKLRVIHDLSFKRGKGDCTAVKGHGGDRSVNADTDWQKVGECGCAGGHLGLQALFGTHKRLLL